ncbi:MAG: DEAD/DEAH box helicase family protein [Candidatus Nomurabacteria bacterium]|jgi:hypothetical protein|nr:DEAD/DEAH box helicase family protein [Candidatus Nomurabacteria bacterium]
MNNDLLNYRKKPLIYVYEMAGQTGVKVGDTHVGREDLSDYEAVVHRISQSFTVKLPNPPKILHYEEAITVGGKFFRDYSVHEKLKERGVKRLEGEWFEMDIDTVKSVINEIKTGMHVADSGRTANFAMRPEQAKAVNDTAEYFTKYPREKDGKAPHYLWNAKMRFGKTFTAYELAKKMGWKRILVLTYKPATEKAWRDDLAEHVDFDGWQFIGARRSWEEANIDESKPVVWFASYQDVLGKNRDTGAIKERHKKMREIDFDCLIVDEYHYGAWRDTAKELSREEENLADDVLEERRLAADMQKTAEEDEKEIEAIEETLPITTKNYLYLSGTPFRALATGEFSEDQIFNWTYADEQRSKREWGGRDDENPYAELSNIVMMTYQMPESLREVAMQGEFNEFDLNKFFAAKKTDGEWRFVRENDVQKFLNNLRGIDLEVAIENKMDYKRPALPYEDARLLSTLTHTFWFLPNVAACRAMENLLRRDAFFRDYQIIRAAGNDTLGGDAAVEPVRERIANGLNTRTITLSCAKLTTGVTVPEWSGVLMLRNIEAPETYFQTAFRAQNPWVLRGLDDPKAREIIKPTCYILDFAPSRALKLMANYSNELGGVNDNRRPETRLEEFIEFLPVLCFDGVSMTRLDAGAILDIATYGTASTMLAKRWQSARLVDVTNVVLEKVLNSPEVLAALENLEQFRGLSQDLSKVINSEKLLKKAKKDREKDGEEPDEKTKKKEGDEEKENRGFKKQLREKLLKFITRIPVFMYLTDYREQKLTDVIRNLEPELFTKITGLSVKDFDKMCEIGVFNQNELNSAIFQFRRFEDSSLTYAGGRELYEDDKIGGFDTSLTRREVDEVIEAEIR